MYRRHRNNLGGIERDILQELTFGDLLISFLCSARSTRAFYKLARERAQRRYRERLALERLIDQGYIARKGEYASITIRGRRSLGQIVDSVRASAEQQKWDGKWRIIMFDIPERLRRSRNVIRGILKRVGFRKLQHSTWIFPYECEELSEFIRDDPLITRHVLYGTLERIQDDDRFRKSFSLPQKK